MSYRIGGNTEKDPDRLRISRRIEGAYVFDLSSLKSIEINISSIVIDPFSKKVKVLMDGGKEIRGESLDSLLNRQILNEEIMKGFSISYIGHSENFEVRIEENTMWVTVDTTNDIVTFAALDKILRILKVSRPWYWFTYYFWIESIIFVICTGLTQFTMVNSIVGESIDPNILGFASGGLTVAILYISRRLIFRRLEFKVGLAAKHADRRSKTRGIIGTVVILGGLVSLGVNKIDAS